MKILKVTNLQPLKFWLEKIVFICHHKNGLKKSKKHNDEENELILFRSFIKDITISDRIATYHIKLQYWDLFDILELKRVLKYDKETILKLFYGINK